MRKVVFAAIALYASCALGAGAAALRVDGSEAGLQGFSMLLDGEFVGRVGDSITIPSSSHQLVIELSSGLQVAYEISYTNSQIKAVAVTESRCVGSTSWLVRSTQLPAVEQGLQGASLKLSRVQVSLEGLCPFDLPNLACQWRQSSLEIHAVPEIGAEVWIDGIQVVGETSKVLSLGFCSGTAPHMVLVLRKAGYADCLASVKMEDDRDPYTVSCPMRKL